MINSSEGIAQPISEPHLKAGDVTEQGEIIHVFNGTAWVHAKGQNMGRLIGVGQLRRPKDKTREKAEEMLKPFRFNTDHMNISSAMFGREDLLNILINMAKWGQENK